MKARMQKMALVYLLPLVLIICDIVNAEDAKITEHPTDVTAVTGGDVILNCVVENLPLEENLVQWTKDGFALGFDRDISGIPNYAMVGDISIGEYNLQITNVSLADEAEYECQVKIGMMRTKAMLTILVPPQGPKIDDVDSSEQLETIDVLAFSENLITCRSWNGKPAANLAWMKDGEKLEENVTYAETDASRKLRNSSATLRIWPTQNDDGDVYECEMNVDQRILNSKLSNGKDMKRSVRLNVQKPPVAELSLSPRNAKEGGTVVARCDSTNSKPYASSFIWSLNGEIMLGKTSSTLYFYKINRTMNGVEIECRSVSSVGQSQPSSAIFSVLYPPAIITSPVDVITNMSATVNFTCSWDSNPPAAITWYKRGATDRVVGDGELLTVEVVDQSAGGTYVCVADAPGAGSKSVSAKLDVLGPPVFHTASTQHATVGDKGTIECNLGSKPGISHVTWSWEHKGALMTLENNDTKTTSKDGKQNVKHAGLVVKGGDTALLIIYHVTDDDMIQYNCTVHNEYGSGSVTIQMQESPASEEIIMVGSIAGAVVGAVLLILAVIIIGVCCVRRRRQQKSTTFTPEHESLHEKKAPEEDNQLEDGMSKPDANGKLLSPDADDDNPSTSASLSSRDGRELGLDGYNRGSAHNDDGYHTEANSWNRAEKHSPDSSPARSAHDDYHRAHAMPSPPLTSSPVNAFDVYNSDSPDDGPLKYNMQPYYPGSYGPNGVVDLPPLRDPRAMSPVNMYGQPAYPETYYRVPVASSSGYRGAPSYPPSYSSGHQRARAGSNTPSIVSSQRSVTPSPAYAAMLGRHTPVSVLGDRSYYVVPTVQPQHGPSSSQSSLENAPSSVAATDPYENASKMSQLSSRISQASRSSEFLNNKQLTARMATHV